MAVDYQVTEADLKYTREETGLPLTCEARLNSLHCSPGKNFRPSSHHDNVAPELSVSPTLPGCVRGFNLQ